MSQRTAPIWWPVRLDPAQQDAVAAFEHDLVADPTPLDMAANDAATDLLARHLRPHLDEILERDSLPHHAHVVNGWGNARHRGRLLLDGYDQFTQRNAAGAALVLQKHPEGEVHPWQSFAYVLMAGVHADAPLGRHGLSIRSLAATSRALGTDEGEELGHLLFTVARLEPDVGGTPFVLPNGTELDVAGLARRAVEAHLSGHFEVCRKMHLTEGLCAAAATLPGLDPLRPVAEGFLAGQLRMVTVLGALLRDAAGAGKAGGSLVAGLQERLALGAFVENHYFLAGHAMELAFLAELHGYRIDPDQEAALAWVTNTLNAWLPALLPQTWFPGCFLHFGHYRRGITLFGARQRARAARRSPQWADLAGYAVDFDALAGAPTPHPPAAAWPGAPHFDVAPPDPGARPDFAEVVARYAAVAAPDLQPRGGYPHFRRVGPPHWLRAVHYELLDDGDRISVEIHLESEVVRPLGALVAGFVDDLRPRLDGTDVQWDPAWYGGAGRLRATLPRTTPPSAVAEALVDVIAITYPRLDGAARSLAVPL